MLALSPRFAPAANNLAGVLSEHGGDKDKALALAQTAKELAPEDPQVSATVGWIFYRRGVHQRALALLKDSVAKLPCNTVIQYHLGMGSAQLGDKEAARARRSPSPRPLRRPSPVRTRRGRRSPRSSSWRAAGVRSVAASCSKSAAACACRPRPLPEVARRAACFCAPGRLALVPAMAPPTCRLLG